MLNSKLVILILLIVFLPFHSKASDFIKDTVLTCRVVKITKTRKSVNKTNKAFIILLQDTVTGRYYNVVSLKEKMTKYKTLEKIKVNKVYSFKLNNYHGCYFVPDVSVFDSINIKGVRIDIPGRYDVGNVNTSSSLVGRYYYKE